MTDPDLDTAKEVYFPPSLESPDATNLTTTDLDLDTAKEVCSPVSPASPHATETISPCSPTGKSLAPIVIDDGLQRRPSHDETGPEAVPPDYPEARSEDFPEAYEKGSGGESSASSSPDRSKAATGRRKWWWWLLGGILLVAVIVGVVLGAVLGTRSHHHDHEASQPEVTKSSPPTSSQTSATSTSSSTSAPAVASPAPDALDVGKSYNASFTYYGTGDQGAGINCTTVHNGCGFYASPGYTVAVSQNLFGSDLKHAPGVACGTCWRLRTTHDASGNVLENSIVAMVNNLCPAQNNPLCAMTTLTDINSWDATVDFNLCIDSGAADALFGKGSGIGLAVGSAESVDCKEWKGKRSDK